jgi:hypothetical protein
MTQSDKSKHVDAAEKLMLDLIDKHTGAPERSLVALFQNVARDRPDVLRASAGRPFYEAPRVPISRRLTRTLAALTTESTFPAAE